MPFAGNIADEEPVTPAVEVDHVEAIAADGITCERRARYRDIRQIRQFLR